MPSDTISEGFAEGKLILFKKAVKYETVREHVTEFPLMNLDSQQSVTVFLKPLFRLRG